MAALEDYERRDRPPPSSAANDPYLLAPAPAGFFLSGCRAARLLLDVKADEGEPGRPGCIDAMCSATPTPEDKPHSLSISQSLTKLTRGIDPGRRHNRLPVRAVERQRYLVFTGCEGHAVSTRRVPAVMLISTSGAPVVAGTLKEQGKASGGAGVLARSKANPSLCVDAVAHYYP